MDRKPTTKITLRYPLKPNHEFLKLDTHLWSTLKISTNSKQQINGTLAVRNSKGNKGLSPTECPMNNTLSNRFIGVDPSLLESDVVTLPTLLESST